MWAGGFRRGQVYNSYYRSGDTDDCGGNATLVFGRERINNRPGLGLAREKSVDRGRKLLTSLEELELEDEDEAQQIAAHLLDHLAGRIGRTTWSIVSFDIVIVYVRDRRLIPVAIMSSTTTTFWPGLMASACIWKKSWPYSLS